MKRGMKKFIRENRALLLRCLVSVVGVILTFYVFFCFGRALKLG